MGVGTVGRTLVCALGVEGLLAGDIFPLLFPFTVGATDGSK